MKPLFWSLDEPVREGERRQGESEDLQGNGAQDARGKRHGFNMRSWLPDCTELGIYALAGPFC